MQIQHSEYCRSLRNSKNSPVYYCAAAHIPEKFVFDTYIIILIIPRICGIIISKNLEEDDFINANYHTHTYRCQHAIGDDRAYVEQAILNGMKVLGFADHCPWVYDTDYVSKIRMKPAEVDDYFSSLQSLKKEYEKDITIYIGLESEYIPELMEKQDKLLADYPLDYMILGQHFNEPEYNSHYNGNGTNSLEQFTRYIDLIIEGMESGRYKYVAHPDLLYYTRDEKTRVEQYTRLCRYFKEHNYPIEINLVGVKHDAHYPQTCSSG